MSTIHQRLMEKIRVIYIEMDEVGVVKRGGRFARLLEPGWHPALSPWNEELVGRISLRPRRTEGKVETNSQDGMPFTTKINVYFSFDPRNAIGQRRMQMLMMVMQRNGDKILQQFMQREAEYALRNQLADLTTKQLLTGSVCSTIERNVRHHILRHLGDSGISLPSPSAIRVSMPEPNPEMLHTHLYIYNQERVAALYERHPTVQQSLLWQNALQNSNSVNIQAFTPLPTGQANGQFPVSSDFNVHDRVRVSQNSLNGQERVPQKDV